MQDTEGRFISSRGYRAAKRRAPSARALRDEVLVGELKRIHAANYSVYGVRKMWHAMRRAGWQVSRDQIARLMRMAGLAGVVRGRRCRTTTPASAAASRPDLVRRSFTTDAPNQLWVADITYVRTTAGWCYTAFMIDAFSRRIAGWSTRSTMTTEAPPLEALEHALVTARDQAFHGLIHHSDRGRQYMSKRYTQRLTKAGIQASVGSRGDSYDNTLAETVNGLYKTELIHARNSWPSITEVEFHTMC